MLKIFSNFNISAEFLPSFLKTIAQFSRCPNFYQKLRNTNFCTPMFLPRFFKISSQFIIIRSYTIMSAKPLRENWKFSQNFIKTLQKPHQLITECLSNFLKMFAKLLSGAHQKNWIIVGRGGRSRITEKKIFFLVLSLYFSWLFCQVGSSS